ncbi:MAG: hypothetical protein WC438_02140 [Candidatus Pacearchaeota archaeon]
MINRKAQLGATFTWFIATIIVMFILVIYLILMSGIFIDKNKIKIGKEENSDNAYSSFVLNSILNDKIEFNGNSVLLKDALNEWIISENQEDFQEELENQIKSKIDNLLNSGEGYLFYVAYNENPNQISGSFTGGGFEIDGADYGDYFYLVSDNFERYGVATEAEAALTKASTIYLNNKFKIRLYIGK